MLSVVRRSGEKSVERLPVWRADPPVHGGERHDFLLADGCQAQRSGCSAQDVKFDGRHAAIKMAGRRAKGQGGQSCAATVCGALAGPSRTKRANRCRFALFLQNVSVKHQVRRAASFSCSFSRNSSSSSASGLTGSSSCSTMVGAAPRLPRSLPNRCSRA